MTRPSRLDMLTWLALALGATLLAGTIAYLDVSTLVAATSQLHAALPLVVVASGLWHLLRTIAWAVSFPDRRPAFVRLLRIRLAAEAFSFVTIRGVAGEPLKVLLLSADVSPRDTTAALALERIAYTVVTVVVLAVSAAVVIASLNLDELWFRTFRVLFIAAAAITAMVTIVIAGRGTYLRRWIESADRSTGRSMASSVVGRFVIDVEQKLLELARESHGRLGILVLLETLCFGLMTLEVWLVAVAIGVPLSWTEAMAVETFSRVVSVLSAFIPANLGALEASNVAAVTAVGAEAAAAPVALARRLRGLWWAIVGFAIYPRRVRRTGGSPVESSTASRRSMAEPDSIDLLYVADASWSDVSALEEIGGLSLANRVLRSAARSGVRRVLVWAPHTGSAIARAAGPASANVELLIASTPDGWAAATSATSGATLVVGPGTVVSPGLLERAKAVARRDASRIASSLADVPAGVEWPASGVYVIDGETARDVGAIAGLLQRRYSRPAALPDATAIAAGRAPLVAHVPARCGVADVEAMVRRAIYKPTDSYLARFNRNLSLPISIWLIRHTLLSANSVSFVVIAIGLAAAWLLTDGAYWTGVAGAALSLIASILDGTDGEIARLTYTDSNLGCWIETFGDYTYYIALFAGLTIGVTRDTGSPVFAVLGVAALAGAIVTFVLLVILRHQATGGHPDQLNQLAKGHFYADGSRWAWLMAKISFVATRSTMPYGILALALLDALPVVVALACIGAHAYWISLALKWSALTGRPAAEISDPVPSCLSPLQAVRPRRSR